MNDVATPTIEYRDETHQYFVAGKEFPSVSTVLSLFADYSRVPRETLEYKRQLGRAVHKAVELLEAGTLDFDTVDAPCIPYLESWAALKKVRPLRLIASEQIVYSVKWRFAGRLDLNVEFLDEPGVFWQCDAKCTYAMDPATALQTAAYAEAWNSMCHPAAKLTKRAGMQLQPDGSIAKVYPYTDRNDFAVFANALNTWRWKMNNYRRAA